ncbi:esterase/lipase family protein [Azospirillum rugosum]|uniref:Lecithin:cholesterol acyltransferase n=1 Tax=Azospirillum rugosum TaxID=416170 RepID=A0ABS4SRU7_9PROT|nr:hypothetical protein [Azospirillum rugosum]MBP2295290.1 hypothetical protein [Azospirillum rugosum]MDQ0528665.1 hypothetical protein [Azospirillum rugosum]
MSGTATVIVFVPGTTASELYDGTTNVWPNVMNSDDGIAQKLEDAYDVLNVGNLAVGNVVSSYPLSSTEQVACYGSLLSYLTTASNFQSGTAFTTFTYNTAVQTNSTPVPVSDLLFYMVPYDWRQDNMASANWLSGAISYLDAAYKAQDQAYNLYLVGHSMGGLVCRGMLESGIVSSSTSWWSNLQSLTTLATPHLGAPLALSAILGTLADTMSLPWYAKLFVNWFLQEAVDSKGFPSTYELLPPDLAAPNQQLFVQGTGDDATKLYDIYDAGETVFQAVLALKGLKTGVLAETKTFFGNLNYTAKPPKPYYCFAGIDMATCADSGSDYAFTFNGIDAITAQTTQNSGDTVVPAESASFATNAANVAVTTFSGYNHGHMGGSDMADYPNAIVTMLALAGVKVVSTADAVAQAAAEPDIAEHAFV